MSAASLIGFAVVFLLVSWLASALLTLALGPLGRRGPAVERRIASLTAALPVLFSAAVTLTLGVASLVGVDHCQSHGEHAHLCLQHGEGWADRSWALAFLAVGLLVVVARSGALALAMIRGHRWLRRLLRSCPDVRASGAELLLVPSDRPFCFVAGLRRPTIFVSAAVRELLAEDEWRAMLAHERGHIAARDLRHRLALELSLLLAAPLCAARVRHAWDSATERLRDSDAADLEAPEAVASALVRLAQASLRAPGRSRTLAVASFVASFIAAFAPPAPAPSSLAVRITSLLDRAPRGERAARRIAGALILTIASLTSLAVALAEPLHHVFETLLG